MSPINKKNDTAKIISTPEQRNSPLAPIAVHFVHQYPVQN